MKNMAQRKVVFIDIDGTLVDDDGNIPPSAKVACNQARQNGHLLFLCTGRSRAEIYDAIWEIGFDGFIGAGGGYIEIGDETLYHKKVSSEQVRMMVDYFNQFGIDFFLESNTALYGSLNLRSHLERRMYGDVENDPVARERKELRPHPFIEGLVFGEMETYDGDVNKVCFLEHPEVPFEQIRHQFQDQFDVLQCTVPIFGENSGEVMIKGVHKATAIADLIAHLGVDREDTIAIGDGMNDIEMLEFCGVGIAMGNAKPALKAIADDVTESIDADGIYLSFVKYGLVSKPAH